MLRAPGGRIYGGELKGCLKVVRLPEGPSRYFDLCISSVITVNPFLEDSKGPVHRGVVLAVLVAF